MKLQLLFTNKIKVFFFRQAKGRGRPKKIDEFTAEQEAPANQTSVRKRKKSNSRSSTKEDKNSPPKKKSKVEKNNPPQGNFPHFIT